MAIIYVGDLAGSPPPTIPYGRYLLDVGALPRPGHVQGGWLIPTVVANSESAIVGAGYIYPTVIAAAED